MNSRRLDNVCCRVISFFKIVFAFTQHIVDLKYYLDYAMAAYGWPIHIYLNPCTGPLSLCASTKGNCCCARCQEPYFEGNECSPNEAAIKAMTGVEDEDIITASFVNAVHIVPFYVVKDERDGQRQVIIAIRGTLSIKVGCVCKQKLKGQSGVCVCECYCVCHVYSCILYCHSDDSSC